MEEQMEVQRSTIQQDVTTNINAQLQRARLISADILAALCVPSPGEPTTAPQANHIICRPSTSSNNQESEGEQRDENNEGCTLGG
ncbi:hypothetical protein KY290_019648 [Solanum tuberosum]|uniref:Integrase core domain containing protein n=1 Tax=Solanum tuberosum TaxID=4113 RepID=A0ABQ7VHN3_SOLTU|nr:hypothetical protein KY289_009284 [Solanum tuberosum]KAH0715949.1 hypothetical protein KY284_008854 [Solanum tuberosum]KAH0763575.1 hypothetical protein KY290_019648 [Solanum tuberosum]